MKRVPICVIFVPLSNGIRKKNVSNFVSKTPGTLLADCMRSNHQKMVKPVLTGVIFYSLFNRTIKKIVSYFVSNLIFTVST